MVVLILVSLSLHFYIVITILLNISRFWFACIGLNCAEAVNFAPADWLPHGGLGAELYSVYHKPAVLSHEELLYVVAKVAFLHLAFLPSLFCFDNLTMLFDQIFILV